jgi:CubicO group peptidase (beta-lactamase class C family)
MGSPDTQAHRAGGGAMVLPVHSAGRQLTRKSGPIVWAAAVMVGLSGCMSVAREVATPATSTPPVARMGSDILRWTPEQQLAGYPAMETMFAANLVERGRRVAPLPAARAPAEISYDYNGETWTADTYMERNRAAGLLILKGGEIALERYRLGHGPDRRWTSFSVAKSFSSTLLGAAVKDGRIRSIEDPVTAYLPGLKGSAYEGVTIRQLLNMTSGVKWNEDYADPEADVAKFAREPSVNGSDPVVSYMARLPREAEPGAKWVYKTGETNLVGSVVRAAVGKPLSVYLSEKVWRPYGMEQDAIWMTDTSGGEVAGCCISATLRDYGRFARFFMTGAQIGGRSILPEGWIAEATRSTPVAETAMNGVSGYGFQWWTNPGQPSYRATGIFGQGIWINPELDLVIVIHSAWTGATDREANAARARFYKAVEDHFRGSP